MKPARVGAGGEERPAAHGGERRRGLRPLTAEIDGLGRQQPQCETRAPQDD
ncbi:hypothetical protein [Glycomyces tenuis]|uniref:hypothetical protein n=1 Tax=Glycomyces tenuis TaxID=58116 RepID=UPI0012DE7977|nr:hypothetical protein [Glycomyces tenuis]